MNKLVFTCCKCKLHYKIASPVSVGKYTICSSCATKFIEALSDWKDFISEEELYFWVTGKDYPNQGQ